MREAKTPKHVNVVKRPAEKSIVPQEKSQDKKKSVKLLQHTVKAASNKPKSRGTKSKNLKTEFINVEEFLKQPQNAFISGTNQNHRRSNPFKLHKSSKTSFINPFNTLKEEIHVDQITTKAETLIKMDCPVSLKGYDTNKQKSSQQRSSLQRTSQQRTSKNNVFELANKYKPTSS